MKNIILLDTAVGTTNKGDDIIMMSTREGLRAILRGNYVINFPTHTTCFTAFQSIFWWKAKYVEQADYKFVCGTNLLANTMFTPINDWNINILNCGPLSGSILVGVGNSRLEKPINWYTRLLYRKVLSHEYSHSVRDEETRIMLQAMGFRAVTTGCPTLWGITPELCRAIPKDKAESVVIAITGSNPDRVRDQVLIDVGRKNYKRAYLWVQTVHDLPYWKTLRNTEEVELIPPDIDAYSEFLKANDVDYVGTRLHGGVFAMQHGKRSIIISIDNRARNINRVNRLNCIERDRIDELEQLVRSRFETRVSVDLDAIEDWKRQFV